MVKDNLVNNIINENEVDEYEQPNPQCVGSEFVKQYYTTLSKAPQLLFRFYTEKSFFVHGELDSEEDEQPLIGQKAIYKKINSLQYLNCRTTIKKVDSQPTLNNGIVLQVSGEISNNYGPMRKFMQTFVLGFQKPRRYYVINDIFRYQDQSLNDVEDSHRLPKSNTEDFIKTLQPEPLQNSLFTTQKGPTNALDGKNQGMRDTTRGTSTPPALHSSNNNNMGGLNNNININSNFDPNHASAALHHQPQDFHFDQHHHQLHGWDKINANAALVDINKPNNSQQIMNGNELAIDHGRNLTVEHHTETGKWEIDESSINNSSTIFSGAGNRTHNNEKHLHMSDFGDSNDLRGGDKTENLKFNAADQQSNIVGKTEDSNILDTHSGLNDGGGSGPKTYAQLLSRKNQELKQQFKDFGSYTHENEKFGGQHTQPNPPPPSMAHKNGPPPPQHHTNAGPLGGLEQPHTAPYNKAQQQQHGGDTHKSENTNVSFAGSGREGTGRYFNSNNYNNNRPSSFNNNNPTGGNRFSNTNNHNNNNNRGQRDGGPEGGIDEKSGPPSNLAPQTTNSNFSSSHGGSNLAGNSPSSAATLFPDNHQVFVGNLPLSMSEAELRTYFSKYGQVVDLKIISGQKDSTRKVPNYGFVIFSSPEPVKQLMNDKPIIYKGHRLNVEEKKNPRGNRPPGLPFSGPGGGYNNNRSAGGNQSGGMPYQSRSGGPLGPSMRGPPPQRRDYHHPNNTNLGGPPNSARQNSANPSNAQNTTAK